MIITSGSSKSSAEWNSTYQKYNYFWNSINKELSKTTINKLIKYALERLDDDLRELVITKGYDIHVDRLMEGENETLDESTYQVNFINERGFRISVDGIFMNNRKPSLDHGIYIAENQK